MIGLKKYERMLGELDLQNFSKVLDDAYDLYGQLQASAPLVREDSSKKKAFLKITQRYLDSFDNLENLYKSAIDEDREYYKNVLKDHLYSLRRFNKAVQEFIDHLVNNDVDFNYYKRISG